MPSAPAAMNGRSPQFFWSGGSSDATCGKVMPWSNDVATTGYQLLDLAIMNAAYTVPSGATVTAGSHVFTFEPTDPGTEIGVLKVRPPSVDRAKAIPRHPIHSS